MSIRLSKIRLVEIDGQVIIAPRQLSVAGVKSWFQKTENSEPVQIRVLGLTDKIADSMQTYASAIESVDCDSSDLPVFL